MATKSGRSKTGTKKPPGRARKSVKRPAERSRANTKRGLVSAKKVASKWPNKSAPGRQKNVTRGSQDAEPKFFIMFKAKQSQDIYLVAVYDDNRLTDGDLNPGKTLNDLEEALSRLPVTVEFAHLLKKNDEIFRTCGPSHRPDDGHGGY